MLDCNIKSTWNTSDPGAFYVNLTYKEVKFCGSLAICVEHELLKSMLFSECTCGARSLLHAHVIAKRITYIAGEP
ncbi:hypothetical protein KSC_088250 [Ktedonobacter sp. SOSP1-52]|nr:hypothetical protein KSC_088250 [Ktedonobacter sp. SOSP1-52]